MILSKPFVATAVGGDIAAAAVAAADTYGRSITPPRTCGLVHYDLHWRLEVTLLKNLFQYVVVVAALTNAAMGVGRMKKGHSEQFLNWDTSIVRNSEALEILLLQLLHVGCT